MIRWTHVAFSSNSARAGRRRWLLNPFATYVSYGQVSGWTVQKVFGFDREPDINPQVEVDYVACPYETYPFHLVEEGTPWSFSVVEDKRNILYRATNMLTSRTRPLAWSARPTKRVW